MGLSTNGWDQDPPESFSSAIKGEKSDSMVMWKCNGYQKGTCDFSGKAEAEEALKVAAPQANDACNKHMSCHECITASEPGVKCGWCMGGKLNYKDGGATKF